MGWEEQMNLPAGSHDGMGYTNAPPRSSGRMQAAHNNTAKSRVTNKTWTGA